MKKILLIDDSDTYIWNLRKYLVDCKIKLDT